MGSRGPIPKRSTERRRRNKEGGPIDRLVVHGEVIAPPCPARLHPQARRWYRSLAHSAQSRYYEPSDWEQARVLAILLSRILTGERASGEVVSAWFSAAAELGVTEGARRRLRVEIERQSSPMAEVTVIDAYRRAREG